MSRQGIYSDAPQGGDRVWLDGLGIVTGLTYSTAYSGGANSATWNFLVPEAFEHRALTPGRRVEILNGASRVWKGRLQEPTPGTPWNCGAVGIGAEAANFRAYAPSSNNALALNEIVDQAISRGLQWTRAATLTTETGTNQNSASMTVAAAMNQVADDNNQYWQLDNRGYVTMGSAPVGPTHLFYAIDTAGARTLNGFVTTLYLHYTDSTSKTIKTVVSTNAAAAARFGPLEDEYDLSSVGTMAAGHAQQYSDALLAKLTPRSYFSDQFTATKGQLCTLGGQPVDLATIAAGINMRVHYVAPSANGEIYPGRQADILIAATEYDSDNETLTLTPVGPPSATYPEAQLTKQATAFYNKYEHWQNDLAIARALAAKAAAARKARRKAAAEKAVMTLKARAKAHHTAYLHSLTTQKARINKMEKAARAKATAERKAPNLTAAQRKAITANENAIVQGDIARKNQIDAQRKSANAAYKRYVAHENAVLKSIKKWK